MVHVEIAGKDYELADTLRVIYDIKDITGAKNLREALQSLTALDVDDQIKLLYAAYKANKNNPIMSANDFKDLILDNCGVFAITDMFNDLANGLMYSGLTPEAAESKKVQIAEATKAGVTSSAIVTE